MQLSDQSRLRAWQPHPGALPGGGLILPLGDKEGGGEGGGNRILWSPFPGTVCAQAGLAAARALQNSGSVESMSFGKVHFAQEPRKIEDSAGGTLKPRASHDSYQVGGRRAELRAGHGPRVGPGSLWCQALGQLRPSAGTVCVCAVGSILSWLWQGSDPPPRYLEKVLSLRSYGQNESL